MLQGKTSITRLNLRHTAERWPFAESERARIDAHWRQRAGANPALWNGEVLMCHKVEIADGCLTGWFLTTDFASMVAWRDWEWPDRSVCNCFGSAVVKSSDGALIFGRMGIRTLNAGRIYPPGGSLEPADITPDGTVDVAGSIERELAEETGLRAADAEIGEWIAVFDGQRISLARCHRFDRPASEIEKAVADYIATGVEDELDGVEIIRSPSQIDSRMPGYAAQIARHFLGERN